MHILSAQLIQPLFQRGYKLLLNVLRCFILHKVGKEKYKLRTLFEIFFFGLPFLKSVSNED